MVKVVFLWDPPLQHDFTYLEDFFDEFSWLEIKTNIQKKTIKWFENMFFIPDLSKSMTLVCTLAVKIDEKLHNHSHPHTYWYKNPYGEWKL